jgi:hypothetical protein
MQYSPREALTPTMDIVSQPFLALHLFGPAPFAYRESIDFEVASSWADEPLICSAICGNIVRRAMSLTIRLIAKQRFSWSW